MGYTTPEAFNDLYFDFTGYAHPGYPAGRRAIAQDLAAALARSGPSETPGPLVVATSTGIYAYTANPGHACLGGASFRATPNTGFYEITAISHVGPAIAYFGAMKELGDDSWKGHVTPLLEHLRAVRAVNAAPLPEHWLTACACPAWDGREAAIKSLVDYACALAGSYLVKVRDDPARLDAEDVVANFLDVSTDEFPVGFNAVMIATFALEGLKSVYEIYGAFREADLNWESTKVLLHNQAGSNFTAGLTRGSNWVHPAVLAIARGRLDPERILITPYAPIPETVGTERLSDEDWDTLANGVWGQLYARPAAARLAFASVPDIDVPTRPPIPGDYEVTKADDLDHFVMRLKHATANVGEMQSNAVGFWLAGEAQAKGWDMTKVDIPGLTHGLPAGMDGYPADAPAIPD